MKIPHDIIHKSIRFKVDKVNWYVHCGDHIMARRPISGAYTVIHKFNAYSLEDLKYYTNVVRIHNENLLLGLMDSQYNKSLE